jgi:hypothetical protein
MTLRRPIKARPAGRHLALAAACAACAVVLSAPAAGLTCYTVLDRNDNVVYRDTYPPIDLSDQGAAERDRLRQRGEHLIAAESDRCPAIEFFTGSAGSAALQVDQVVDGMPARKAVGAPEGPSPRAAPGAGALPPSQRAAPAPAPSGRSARP